MNTGGGDRSAALRQISGLLAEGRLTTEVAGTLSLDEAADAYRTSTTGHVRGKLVVLPRG